MTIRHWLDLASIMDWTDCVSKSLEAVAKIIITIRKRVFHRVTTTLENINSCGQPKGVNVDNETNKCVGYPHINMIIHSETCEKTIFEVGYPHYPQNYPHNSSRLYTGVIPNSIHILPRFETVFFFEGVLFYIMNYSEYTDAVFWHLIFG